MLEGKNIALSSVLLEIAIRFAEQHPGELDIEKFCADMMGEAGKAAFRKDMQEVKYYQVTRFPTLILKSEKNAPLMIMGCQPYGVLLGAIKKLRHDIQPVHKIIDPNAYSKFWGNITHRELQEIKNNYKHE
jgi:predicted DsbA family dithiol-disulfide isomerase